MGQSVETERTIEVPEPIPEESPAWTPQEPVPA